MDNLDKNEEYKNINELLQGVRGYQMTEEKENNNDINPKDSMDYSKGDDKYHYEYYEEITYQN